MKKHLKTFLIVMSVLAIPAFLAATYALKDYSRYIHAATIDETIELAQWDEENLRWHITKLKVITKQDTLHQAYITDIYFEYEDPNNPNRSRYVKAVGVPWGMVPSVEEYVKKFGLDFLEYPEPVAHTSWAETR